MNQIQEDRYTNPDNDPRGPYLKTNVTVPYRTPKNTFKWNNKLPPNGRGWRFSEEKANELEKNGEIIFLDSGMPVLKRYLADIKQIVQSDIDSESYSRLEFIIRNAMKSIAKEVANNPATLYRMEWRDLERVLREVFESIGFSTELTRSGKDGGFDLKLTANTQIFLVEVKHWLPSGRKPGASVLTSFIDVIASASENTKGVILSTSGFTKNVMSARSEIEQYELFLGGKNKIVSLCHNYLETEAGVLAPMDNLSDVLIEGTIQCA
ncbi:restriction endonuclease [Vibrio sp. Hal054]|uniref:restriction endonuclease n=1 Tax=Vibrio sp. Hal054 TaxID=3035158 RepID=UPI00301CADB6